MSAAQPSSQAPRIACTASHGSSLVDGLAAHCGFVAIVMRRESRRSKECGTPKTALRKRRMAPLPTALHADHHRKLDSRLFISIGLSATMTPVRMQTAGRTRHLHRRTPHERQGLGDA